MEMVITKKKLYPTPAFLGKTETVVRVSAHNRELFFREQC
jgi:hypothetical protein